MKAKQIIPRILLVLVLLFAAGWILAANAYPIAQAYIRLFPKSVTVTDEPVTPAQNYYHTANDRQYNASVRLFCWENKLYFYPYRQVLLERDAYYRKLCVFENGSVTELTEQLDGMLYGMRNGYFYYEEEVGGDGYVADSYRVWSFDASSGQRTFLTEIPIYADYSALFFSDDVLYLRQEWTSPRYCRIRDDRVIGDWSGPESYVLGDMTYYVSAFEYGVPETRVRCRNANGEEKIVFQVASAVEGSFGEVNLLPCDAGLIIHNDGTGSLLHLISETDHSVRELLSFPCGYSESAVTVFGDWVYVSFFRYEYLPAIPYEEDDISGTYRIHLTDHTVEKLSDHYYNGLFIFDDTGIYACDDACNIYKLDFDGNVVMTLLSHESDWLS